MGKSGAIFDIVKLDWMNSEYIKALSEPEYLDRLHKYLEQYDRDFYDHAIRTTHPDFTKKIMLELKTRLKKFSDFHDLASFFYSVPKERIDLLVNEKMKVPTLESAKESLEFSLQFIMSLGEISSLETLKTLFLEAISKAEKKNGQILWPVRVALSGEEFSPGAIELIYIF